MMNWALMSPFTPMARAMRVIASTIRSWSAADRCWGGKTATESPESMQILSAFGAAVAIAPFALAEWVWPTGAASWLAIAVCGLAGGIGHQCMAMAHRHASAAVLGPFIYQQILYMVLWGWLLFGQLPDRYVVVGAAVVVASGLYLLWLEMRKA